jgi:acid phosphatase type 7
MPDDLKYRIYQDRPINPPSRRYGLPSRTALQQVQFRQGYSPNESFEPLPAPVGPYPYRLALSDLGPDPDDQLVFHVTGDTGGIVDAGPQKLVAGAMAADLTAIADPAHQPFFYHVGDVVYFNGSDDQYLPQFYEPYEGYHGPILPIPGNHDGDPLPGETSLGGFVTNFVQATPHLSADAGDVTRDAMTLPNVYWTLTGSLITLIGLYSNVPSGGVIDSTQEAWLVEELKAAPTDRALIVALHHPPYSADAHHGGSQAMGQLLDDSFAAANRSPNLILSGHVHDYQRFTRSPGITYIVAGGGGYHNLHEMASGLGPLPYPLGDVELQAFCDQAWGFLRLKVTLTQITGVYFAVDAAGNVASVDGFEIPI